MAFKGLQPIVYGGREVWPIVEGGKGVSATNHMSSGAWAAAGGIGTVSAVNADSYDPEGRIVPQVYAGMTRKERHEELINYAIAGAVQRMAKHLAKHCGMEPRCLMTGGAGWKMQPFMGMPCELVDNLIFDGLLQIAASRQQQQQQQA